MINYYELSIEEKSHGDYPPLCYKVYVKSELSKEEIEDKTFREESNCEECHARAITKEQYEFEQEIRGVYPRTKRIKS